MTRVLYWNVRQFSENNLLYTQITNKRSRFGIRQTRNVQRRRDYLLNVLTQTGADILAIVEVACNTQAPERTLIYETGGFLGLRELLQYLRAHDAASNWNLVPPIVIGTGGRAEGVGVFYKSTFAGGGTRYFTGPNRFSGTSDGESFDPADAGAPADGDYPDENQASGMDYFSAHRQVPAASPYNANFTEDRCAARTFFESVANTPNKVDFDGLRSPYMTSFFEDDGAGNTRTLSLISVHAPPNYDGSRQFVIDLADCTDVANANLVGETKLIVGDFNINLMHGDGTQAARYDPLVANPAIAGNYDLLLQRDPATPWDANTTPGYFATHIMAPKLSATQARGARFSSTIAEPLFYPGYGYIGSSNADGLYSLDNALVRPTAPGVRTSIVNAVVGSPMNNPAWAGGGTAPPVGAIAFATTMADGAPPNSGNPNNQATAGAWNRQLGFDNYGHISEGSDHLPLITEV